MKRLNFPRLNSNNGKGVIVFAVIVLLTVLVFFRSTAGELASWMSQRAEATFFTLISAIALFCLWRAYRFYFRKKSLPDAIITGIFLALIMAGFIFGYYPKNLAEMLAENPGASELFLKILLGILAFLVSLWAWGDIHTRMTSRKSKKKSQTDQD